MHEVVGTRLAAQQQPAERFEDALRLCIAFWPTRWSRVALVVALSLGPNLIDVDKLPEFLDELTEHFASANI